MSSSIGSLSTEAARLRGRMEVLTRQAASGQRAEALGDLSPAVPRTIALRAELGRREVYGRAMDQALARADVTQNALSRMTDIAREFRTQAGLRANSSDPRSLVTLGERARSALSEVAHLLNSRHAGEYVFGGSDIGRPPVPDPDGLAGGPMAQDIAAAINALAPGNAGSVAAQTLSIAGSTAAGTSPFSAFLDDPARGGGEARRATPSGDGEVIAYGIPANRNGAAVSGGVSTGGWARDLLRNLMSVAALTPAQMAAPADFNALVNSIRQGFESAESALGEESGALGSVEQPDRGRAEAPLPHLRHADAADRQHPGGGPGGNADAPAGDAHHAGGELSRPRLDLAAHAGAIPAMRQVSRASDSTRVNLDPQ
jgi:flagellin-like hook-associated protein FlgL